MGKKYMENTPSLARVQQIMGLSLHITQREIRLMSILAVAECRSVL
jgi:hypothetical protein